MVRAGLTELRNAFHGHRKVATGGSTESHSLLLFYAAECGLKAAWLHRNRKLTSDDFPDSLTSRSHDLSMWLKELRVGARMGVPPTLRLARDNHSLHISQVHEAWRYGVRVRLEDEASLRTWLERVCTWAWEAMLR